MSDHKKEHPHQGHAHPDHGHHGHEQKEWRWHRDWRTWVGVLLMLAAMAAYVLSDSERFGFGGPARPEMPAAP
ncbi:MAG TPA: hypothetical protein VHY91_27220 [Pirellulales bacterium]|jgi:hypothetical protein|nr:hypothetical protein [Pirellulales bacterium]